MNSITSVATLTKDFNGLPIVFREDGYINMTKAAKAFGKKDAYEFIRLPSTQDYIHAIAQVYIEEGKAGIFPVNEEGAHMLYDVKKGRYGGTFCHPKLAVFFARWLDVRFAVWYDLMIDNILKGNIQTTVVVPTQEASQPQNKQQAHRSGQDPG